MKNIYKERCTNCVALVEGDNHEWICDEKCKNIYDVQVCPEGLELEERK